MITQSMIEAAAHGSVKDRTALYRSLFAEIQSLKASTGTQLLQAGANSGTQGSVQGVPPAGSISVTGADGSVAIAITPVSETPTKTVYQEISYSPSVNFASDIVTLPVTTATSQNVAMPGGSFYWRFRSSYDQKKWNAYQQFSGVVDAGLISSESSNNAVPLNQSNYATIDSVDGGSSANVRVQGNGGYGSSYPAIKGTQQRVLPGATIINVPYGSQRVVAYDPKNPQYLVKSDLPAVFADHLIPVGAVSVVGAGGVVLPTVSLVVDGSGRVIAWNVITQGNGLTTDVTLVINTTTGSGATPGAQTRSAGKLISISPGNPGLNYDPSDTVTVSGGVSGGAAGGGQTIGGNGGRLVFSDGTTAGDI